MSKYFLKPTIKMNLVAEINDSEEIVKETIVNVNKVDFVYKKMDISYTIKIDGILSRKNTTVDYTPFINYLKALGSDSLYSDSIILKGTWMRILKRIWSRVKTGTFIRNYKSDKEVDDWFNKHLENPNFEFLNESDKENFNQGIKPYTILLNGQEIWVRNKYYASPRLYSISQNLPYMDTTVKFFKAYDDFLATKKLPLEEMLKKLQRNNMTLYDIYRYKPEEIIEIEKLLDLVYKLGVEDEVQEAFFQFSPRLIMDKKDRIDGFGEHETWFASHKRSILIEIIVFLIESITKDEYEQEEMINYVVNDEKYFDFVDDSLYYLSKEEIIEKFKRYISEEFSKNF